MRHPMKYMLGTFLGLTLALSAAPGHAQDEAKIKATIPFNGLSCSVAWQRITRGISGPRGSAQPKPLGHISTSG